MALIDAGKIVFRGSPAGLMEHARGKVFEVEVDAATEKRLAEKMEIVSLTRGATTSRIRAVTVDGEPPEGATVVQSPTLEEAYLAFMAARGRAEVALAEEES